MITHTISVTEIIWTLFCLIGLIYNVRILRRAMGDLFEVRARRINSLREYSARLTVFVYSMLTFVQLAFVVIGVAAMLVPTPGHETVTPTSEVLTVVFILVSAVMAIGSFINEHGRRKLVEKIAELEKF